VAQIFNTVLTNEWLNSGKFSSITNFEEFYGGGVGRGTALHRDVADSIVDGVFGIFYRLNPSGRTMTLV
jgi:hypothetical protein